MPLESKLLIVCIAIRFLEACCKLSVATALHTIARQLFFSKEVLGVYRPKMAVCRLFSLNTIKNVCGIIVMPFLKNTASKQHHLLLLLLLFSSPPPPLPVTRVIIHLSVLTWVFQCPNVLPIRKAIASLEISLLKRVHINFSFVWPLSLF
jgi:hypothetical protein